jgi:hypothetical protein
MVELPSDEPVQFVGVYVLKWQDVVSGAIMEPTVGFIEESEDDAARTPEEQELYDRGGYIGNDG